MYSYHYIIRADDYDLDEDMTHAVMKRMEDNLVKSLIITYKDPLGESTTQADFDEMWGLVDRVIKSYTTWEPTWYFNRGGERRTTRCLVWEEEPKDEDTIILNLARETLFNELWSCKKEYEEQWYPELDRQETLIKLINRLMRGVVCSMPIGYREKFRRNRELRITILKVAREILYPIRDEDDTVGLVFDTAHPAFVGSLYEELYNKKAKQYKSVKEETKGGESEFTELREALSELNIELAKANERRRKAILDKLVRGLNDAYNGNKVVKEEPKEETEEEKYARIRKAIADGILRWENNKPNRNKVVKEEPKEGEGVASV